MVNFRAVRPVYSKAGIFQLKKSEHKFVENAILKKLISLLIQFAFILYIETQKI